MRRLPYLVALLAAAILTLAFVQPGAVAQTGTPPASDHGFVGAWHLTTETPFGTSQSLITISSDGTILFTDRPVYPGGGDFPVTFISTGHGTWHQTGPSTAIGTWVEFMTDGKGNFLGVVTDSAEMTLSSDGTTWEGTFSSSTADPTGKTLYVGGGTVKASRIEVQPLATPAATPAT